MRRILLIVILIFFPLFCLAEEHDNLELEKVTINTHDQAAIERGAKFFANNCMVCHTMKYLQYNKLASSAGITVDKMPIKTNEALTIKPPDLTLIARIKSPDWLYTYFHSFYRDPNRPTGFNNLIAKDVNMMNIFAGIQGVQEIMPNAESELAHDDDLHYYSVLKLEKSGSMSPEEFDQTTTDLVNFLVYASDPTKNQRENLGVWVLLFLAVLFVLAYLLKKIYWKNIK